MRSAVEEIHAGKAQNESESVKGRGVEWPGQALRAANLNATSEWNRRKPEPSGLVAGSAEHFPYVQ